MGVFWDWSRDRIGVLEGPGGFFGSRAQVICGGSPRRICITVPPALRLFLFFGAEFPSLVSAWPDPSRLKKASSLSFPE